MLLFLCLVVVEIELEVVDGVLLAVEQEADLIVDELKLPGHFFVDIVDLVHGTDGAVDTLEVGEVLVKGVLHSALLLLGQCSSLLVPDCLLQQILLAGVCDQ